MMNHEGLAEEVQRQLIGANVQSLPVYPLVVAAIPNAIEAIRQRQDTLSFDESVQSCLVELKTRFGRSLQEISFLQEPVFAHARAMRVQRSGKSASKQQSAVADSRFHGLISEYVLSKIDHSE